MSVSNNGSSLAFSTDTDGSERYRMVVKNLDTGEMREDEIEETIGSAVWAADDASFFYTVVRRELASVAGAPARDRGAGGTGLGRLRGDGFRLFRLGVGHDLKGIYRHRDRG